MATTQRIAIAGSARAALHGAQELGPVPPDERLEVTVRVRRKTELQPGTASLAHTAKPQPRLTREQFERTYGASAQDLAKVAEFAKAHNLVVVGSDVGRRSVFLSGTAHEFGLAFGTSLAHFAHDGGTYRGRTGELSVPADLKGIVEGVFGLDDRPAAKPHFQYFQPPTAIGMAAHAAPRAFTPIELARLYHFPAGLTGKGQTIGIIELGGGYRPVDLKAYFARLGLKNPSVTTVRVDGATNHPSTADSADGEVMLDIEVAAAVAPDARIVVYFAPNTDKGFLDAITTAIHDKTHAPGVVSISWGAPETGWTEQALRSYDQAFQSAAALGVTVCAAAGDNGSDDGVHDGKVHVDFPASSPFVLACGGTRVTSAQGRITAETVWNAGPGSATGGGFSGKFKPPGYQDAIKLDGAVGLLPATPGRGVPDVAGDADPATGYVVRVDGQDQVIGGTSAVAPLWAGLIALCNESLGTSVGFLNPLLYSPAASKAAALSDIRSGNNGAWKARAGWDPCTGLGSPHGQKLLELLQSQPA